MNSFANALFSAFFGWLKSVAQMLFRVITQPGSSGFLNWIADHWVLLLVILLVLGTAIDLTVYMLRWRPFEVWASFFRRRTERRRSRREPSVRSRKSERMRSVEKVPDDDAYVIPATGMQRTPETLTYADPMTDIEYGETAGETVETERTETAEELEPYGEETSRHRRSQPTRKKGVRHLIRRILAEEEEDVPKLKYSAAQPPVDARDAYGDPYIPPQWKQPEDKRVRNKRSEREDRNE